MGIFGGIIVSLIGLALSSISPVIGLILLIIGVVAILNLFMDGVGTLLSIVAAIIGGIGVIIAFFTKKKKVKFITIMFYQKLHLYE